MGTGSDSERRGATELEKDLSRRTDETPWRRPWQWNSQSVSHVVTTSGRSPFKVSVLVTNVDDVKNSIDDVHSHFRGNRESGLGLNSPDA